MRAIKAQYERYVNMVTSSSNFAMPNEIRSRFLSEYQPTGRARRLVGNYDKMELDREVIILQREAVKQRKNQLGIESTRAILTRANDNPQIEDAYFKKIEKSVIEKQLSDFESQLSAKSLSTDGQ